MPKTTITVFGQEYSVEQGPPCGKPLSLSYSVEADQEYKKVLRHHVTICADCRSRKRPRVEPDVSDEVSGAFPVLEFTSVGLDENLKRILRGLQLNVRVTGMTRTETGSFRCEAMIEATNEWPSLINPSTHVEWDDSDQGIPGLHGDLEISTGLQQKWTLLLKDAILCNQGMTVHGLVVETYDRNHERDSFAERQDTKAISSIPSGNHWYKHITVTSRPAKLGGSSVIVVGTERLNAIFTNVVVKDEEGLQEIDIGQSAGAGFFEPSSTTRVFLSKDSIEAARKHDGIRFAEVVTPRLAQLRGIFSHFHHTSAFSSARTGQAGNLPATVFTFPNFGLFAVIASAMMDDPASAVLKREDVKQAISQSRHKALEKLLVLMGNNTEIHIQGDDKLDKVLRRLAKSVRPLIKEANAKHLPTAVAATVNVEE